MHLLEALGPLSSKGLSLSNSSSQGSGSDTRDETKDWKSQRRWRTPRKQCLLDKRAKINIWTLTDCGSMHRTWTGPGQMGFQHSAGKWTWALIANPGDISKCYLQTKGKNEFSPMDSHCVHKSHWRVGPSPAIFSQPKTKSRAIFWVFKLCLAFFSTLVVSITIFNFIFLHACFSLFLCFIFFLFVCFFYLLVCS